MPEILPHDLFHKTEGVIKCVVPISGGKDSQACLELALKDFTKNEIRGLFCDTKYEHPLTYKHIEWIAENYGIIIDTVCGGSVIDKVKKYKRWPGGGSRHCTDELKIRETKIYLKNLAESQGIGFEVWYGMRWDESTERRKRYADKLNNELYPPHEVMRNKYPKYLAKMGVMFRLPILDWTTAEVFDFLGGRHHPLYDKGFWRIGCFPCQAAGDAAKEMAYTYDEFGAQQYAEALEVSKYIGKSLWTSKGGKARNEGNQGCVICSI